MSVKEDVVHVFTIIVRENPVIALAGSAAVVGGGEQTLSPTLEPDHMCAPQCTCGLNNTGVFCSGRGGKCVNAGLLMN